MRFASRTEEDYSLQLTSLIDVVFLLLIFFMVSTTFVDFTRRMDILLPKSKKSTEVIAKAQNFLLEVGVEKKLSLNGEAVTFADLERRLKQARKKPGKRTLTIKADKRLDYGFVVQIMGISFAAGIRDISVAVKE